ncbi:MAG TPA: c-type cytochrome [Thermoanaerobaculia bacterium]|jgi:cytochrome c2
MKRLLPILFLLACNREAPAPVTQTAAPAATVSVDEGRQLVSRYGCGVCHVVPGVEGAQGRLGPSLAGIASRPKISFGTVDNTPANLAQFIQDPASRNPQTSMPPMAITDAEADAIAAYLGTLK